MIIELPAGVFLMYPSSLFFHFNVDICGKHYSLKLIIRLITCLDVEFVRTNGEIPTPQNSMPINGADGRGSCVWFNQATMFQSTELGHNTVADAKLAGNSGTSDFQELLRKDLFPTL